MFSLLFVAEKLQGSQSLFQLLGNFSSSRFRFARGLCAWRKLQITFGDDGARPVRLDPQARDLTNVDAACLLDRAVESAREQFGSEVAGQLVERGPATALLETVRDGDLLVMGSRGRGALAARLFGSTVNTVLDRCAVPVVVVRGADEAE